MTWTIINLILLAAVCVFFFLFWKDGQKSEAYGCYTWLILALGLGVIDAVSWAAQLAVFLINV